MGFANHAQLLCAKLSPLVDFKDGILSRPLDQSVTNQGPVPATALVANTEQKPAMTKLPFMGHVSIRLHEPSRLIEYRIV
jgi:hypothetical protein